MWLLYFLIVGYVILSVGLFFIFKKAGVEAWKGLIPVLNLIEWSKIIGRPAWWPVWLIVPIVNIFIFCGMIIDLVRSFGKLKFFHSFLAVAFGPIYALFLGTNKEDQYMGPILDMEKEYAAKISSAKEKGNERIVKQLELKNPYKKSGGREWVESIIFAVFAAAFIRMFLIEAFVIPTSSMEGSLLVGDFLFVSKAHYGIRTPMTVAMIPLLHNRIPFLNTESYLKKPALSYHRLPKLQEIQRNTPLVFNWPVGDSVYVTPERSWTSEQARRIPYVKNLTRSAKLIVRPIDKKDHYIKRCVALPGDTLEIIDKQIYINGQASPNPEHMQFEYYLQSPTGQVNTKLLERIGVNLTDRSSQGSLFLNNQQAEQLKKEGLILIPGSRDTKGEAFPYDPEHFQWSFDNFGPLWMPKAGTTVEINQANIELYRRIISVYENNDLEISGEQILINGSPATSYTFKQGYYWAMGDNRHNSEDSRDWGFVPEDHVVGKPLFIWFSTKNGSIKNGINWNRIFTTANKN